MMSQTSPSDNGMVDYVEIDPVAALAKYHAGQDMSEEEIDAIQRAALGNYTDPNALAR